MGRTVDRARHEARRLQIIDAALTCFATCGYDGATTAAICRQAQISSGTFFHYFPTKVSVLIAILEHGTQETIAWFASQKPGGDPREVVTAYVEHTLADFTDDRIAGFVRAVSAVMTEPEIAKALAADDAALRSGLKNWLTLAQEQGQVRRDLTSTRLTSWLMLLLDGFLGQMAVKPTFTVDVERDTLLDTVARLLEP